jgi:hypothetical protein
MKPTALRNIFHRLYFDLTDQPPQVSYRNSFYDEGLSERQISDRLNTIKDANQATTEFFSNFLPDQQSEARSHFQYDNIGYLIDFTFDYIVRDFCREHGLEPEEHRIKDLFADNKGLSDERREKCGRICRAFAAFIEQSSPDVGRANYVTAGHLQKEKLGPVT